MIFVTVMEPQGREIYINGVYDESIGQAALTTMLEPGAHLFEAVISVGPDPLRRLRRKCQPRARRAAGGH
jgi:hypothetical protein